MDVDGLARRLVEVRVAPDRADEGGDAGRRLLQLGQQRRAHRRRPRRSGGRRPGRRSPTPAATRSTHSGPSAASVSADAISKASGTPRCVERLEELLLAIALGERVEPLAPHRLLGGLGGERRRERRALRAGAPASRSPRRPPVAARSYSRSVATPARGGGRRVVQLVRQPGGELADREELLAVALDALDRAAHGLDRRQELAKQRRVREREPAELLAVQLEHERLGDGAGGPAVRGVGEARHRPEVAARPVGHHQDLLAGDLPRRLQLPVEHDVEGGRAVALAEEELAGSEGRRCASGLGEPVRSVVADGWPGSAASRRRSTVIAPPA